MANPGHLGILEKGVPSWNEWRRQNPAVIPDLRGADLSRLELSYANFSGALLSKAAFWKSDCRFTDFREADLSNASMEDCRIENADFSSANMENADLSGALKERANFSDTCFDRKVKVRKEGFLNKADWILIVFAAITVFLIGFIVIKTLN